MDPRIEEYLLKFDESFHENLRAIHELIELYFPELKLKIVFDTPFYYLKKRVLYLTVLNRSHVRLGFCKGAALEKTGLVFHGSSKEVAYMDYLPGQKAELPIIKELIESAVWYEQNLKQNW